MRQRQSRRLAVDAERRVIETTTTSGSETPFLVASIDYANTVRFDSPTTTSGWLNSDALDGTSLPTNGTASSLRDLGIFGSA